MPAMDITVTGRVSPASERPSSRQANAVGSHHVTRYAMLSAAT